MASSMLGTHCSTRLADSSASSYEAACAAAAALLVAAAAAFVAMQACLHAYRCMAIRAYL